MSTISDRMLYVHLAEGICIVAAREVPFPHRYTMTVRGVVHEMSVDRAQALVDDKIIVGAPVDALWDRITFRVADRDRVRDIAFRYLPRGWGYCAHCGEMVEPSAKHEAPTAPRHGFTFKVVDGKKKENSPACDGSLKPLLDPVIPQRVADVAA